MVLAALAARPGISAARLAHHADGARNAEEVRRFADLAATNMNFRISDKDEVLQRVLQAVKDPELAISAASAFKS